jgi:hypothetical protein
MKSLDEMTSEEQATLLEDESMGINPNEVDSMLDWEQEREKILLTPLPGGSLSERVCYAVKRFFQRIRRNFINDLYRGRHMHFESHEEYEDWRRKIAYCP